MLSIGILSGAGSSLLFTPAVSSIGHYFLARRALATGIAATGGATGGIIFPLMLQSMFPKIGFAWSIRVLALIDAFLCLASVFLVRSNRVNSSTAPKARSIKEYLPDLRILKKASFAWTTAGVFFMEWGLFIPIAYIASFATQTGAMSVNSATILITLLNTGSVLGRFMPGFFADKLGRFNAMIILLVFCGLSALGLWLPATLISSQAAVKSMTISFALLFGFASGANISLTPVCVGQLCPTSEYGRYYATCYTIVAFGTLTGIPIAGMLIKACQGGYLGVILFTGICYVFGTVCFVLGRAKEVGWRLKEKDGSGWVIF
jgi:MFS family permease